MTLGRRTAAPRLDLEMLEDVAPDPPPPTRRLRRRTVVAGVTVLAVAAAGAVTAQVVSERREDARVATVGRLPGAAPALDGPPTVLWETTDVELYGGLEVLTRVGLLTGVKDASEGPVQVRAVDPATGRAAWTVDVLDGTGRAQRPPGATAVDAPSGYCDGGPHATVVVCLVDDGLAARTRDGEPVDLPPSRARLVALDPLDGTVTADLSAAAGVADDPSATQGLTFVVLDDVVVLATEIEEGTTAVRAVTLDGATAWERTVHGPTRDTLGLSAVWRVGDALALVTSTDVLVLDAAGKQRYRVPVGDRAVARWDEDTLALLPRDAFAAEGPATLLHADAPVETTHLPVPVALDDGSVPGLVLTRDGPDLRAQGAAGDLWWTVRAGVDVSCLVLDGRVHAVANRRLVTLDARSGRELWRSQTVTALPVTDGRHLLGVAADPGPVRDPGLVALDPADGSEVWRAALPSGAVTLRAHDGMLLAGDPASAEGTVWVLGSD